MQLSCRLQPYLLWPLVAGSAAGLLLVRWLGQRRIWRRMEEARRRRGAALEHVEASVQHFRQQNLKLDAGSILSLPLMELTRKLKEGSLSPESVLYTYMGKGHDSTMGLVHYLFRPMAEDGVIVQVLKAQGAIPFVKTNVPQSMLNYDCSNLIFGQTLNPHNHKKTPGGSSGGEAALIARGGSILGLGTDLGGSLRFPSAFCGICCLKTTGNRLSRQGMQTSSAGQKTVTAAAGPMARDVDSLALCMKALLCDHMFRLDPSVPPIPFRDEVYTSSYPLRIGYYETDGFMMPTPSMSRAVLETKELLEAAGHQLVAFVPPRVDYAVLDLVLQGLMADGGSTFVKKFKGDLVDPNLQAQVSMFGLPRWVKGFLSIVLWPLYPRMAKGLQKLRGVSSVQDLWQHHTAAAEYCQEFLAAWKKMELDVVLCPALSPALTIGYPGKLFVGTSYTILYNLLDFPAGVVPVTKVTEEDERKLKLREGYYMDLWDKNFTKAMEGGVGLPVAVQCVALPWQEELCLRFMKEVERLTQATRWSGRPTQQ
ncbi:fatty-acid amide hydrolase 1-like isoform X2 [Rhinatrema bivittatum]|uniref:fatty-acid amide hydrolase 1-like isoform X2 n=1 Tax=Rhinatrema bivittatum TaxID=194408 RepID=UPI001128938D|nr:fatty-acid amide hydrolase 1-like isoform X2 [Rhinatrema bivittatum]